MRRNLVLAAAAAAICLVPGAAAAFDFGFVRVPGWMAPWIAGLALALVLLWAVVAATKPRHVAFRDLYRSYGEMNAATRIAHLGMAAVFVILMAMVFLGMGLQRYAEAAAG